MKIGDLFIKLGLQKGEFDKGIDDAKQKTTGFGGSLKQMSVLATSAWAAVGTGAIMAFNAIKNSSDTLSTKWEVMIGGMNAASNEFFRTLAIGDWSNFMTNLKDAIKVGREYVEMLDEIEEMQRASTITEAKMLKENTQLEIDAANRMLSIDKRKSAAEQRIKNEEELGRQRVAIAKKAYDEERKVTAQQTRLSEQQLERVASDFQSIGKEKAKQINEFYDHLSKTTTGQFGEKQIREKLLSGFEIAGDKPGFSKYIKPFTESEVDYSEALRKMGDTTDEQLNKMVNAYMKLAQAEESVLGNTRRIRIRLSVLEAGDEKEAEKEKSKTAADELAAIKKVNDELEAQRILKQELKGEKMTPMQGIGTPDSLSSTPIEFMSVFGNLDSHYDEVKEKREKFTKEELQGWTDFTNDLNQIISQGIGDAIASMSEGFGEMLGTGDWDWANFGKQILNVVGQFMQTLGGLFIAYAIASKGFAAAIGLGPLNPMSWGLAMAAGVGLIAAGSAISSFAGSGGKSSASAPSAASGYSNYSQSNAVAAITGNVVFELEGTKLRGALNNTDRKNNLIK